MPNLFLLKIAPSDADARLAELLSHQHIDTTPRATPKAYNQGGSKGKCHLLSICCI